MVGHALKLGAALNISQILVDFSLLSLSCQLRNEFALRRKNHESNTEHSIGTGCEDGEVLVRVLNRELHLSTLRASNPVALSLLDRIAPLNGIQSVEQTLSISRYTETPLLHLTLYNRITATDTHSIDNLIIGKHGTKTGTPVYHGLTKVSNAVVHQSLLLLLLRLGIPLIGSERQFLTLSNINTLRTLLLKVLDKLLYRLSLLAFVAIERVEHLLECPLSPMIITRITSTNLTIPVEREANLIELLTVVGDILIGSLLRMLSCLDGILLGR